MGKVAELYEIEDPQDIGPTMAMLNIAINYDTLILGVSTSEAKCVLTCQTMLNSF